MCQNSISGKQSDQIRKFVEHGMPEKIVKTVQYTLRKRAAEQQKPTEGSMENFGHHGETRNNANAATATAAVDPIVASNASNQQHSTNNVETFNIPRLCGRFLKMQANSEKTQQDKITNISATGTEDNTTNNKKMQHPSHISQMDALAITTQVTKVYVQRLYGVAVKMQSSKLYKLLTRTTQPAHLIAVAVLTFVLFTVWPDIVYTRNSPAATAAAANNNNNGEQRPQRLNTLAAIAYLGAFATHFGAQIWMTFVSGLSLYFSLPRHTFGQCQQILFPRYFALSSILSISMLILFVKYFLHSWNVADMVQLISLGCTAVIEVIIRLYLAPPMLRLMHEKYRIEGAIGSGREVGTLEQGDLIQCPHYQRIHKTFRRIHMTIAMGNMAVLLATCLHLYFLASKIQIS